MHFLFCYIAPLAPGLQVRPGVAVIRLAQERDRRFNDVVGRTHPDVLCVVEPRLNLVAVGIGWIAHLHEAIVFHAVTRLAVL